MHNSDVLGDEGRKALNACVKVKIYGKPEKRIYDCDKALEQLRGCYADLSSPWLFSDHPTLPEGLPRLDFTKPAKTFDIVDIHDALVRCDEKSYVDKYPREGPESDKMRHLIDKRRADVEREYEEATADPEGRCRYSWVVAQRRVRDCFAGIFPGDGLGLIPIGTYNEPYSVIDIHDEVVRLDEWSFVKGYLTIRPARNLGEEESEERGRSRFCGPFSREKELKEIEERRAGIEKEFEEAKGTPGVIQKYSRSEAELRVKGCYYGFFPPEAVILPVKMDESGMLKSTQDYDIFDIRKAVHYFDGKKVLDKYPDEGPGSDELKKLIDEHRDNLNKEYQKATCDTGSKSRLQEYSMCEAERRVRDSFAGTRLSDTDIFPTKKDQNGIPKIYQTYDIFDIKKALEYFDAKKLCKKYPEKGPEYDEIKQSVDEQRAAIKREYAIATTDTEIEHGSGFIVHDHFIITNRHVIETCLNEPESHEIRISNAAIGELACKVIRYDAGKDLALLYCPDLNLEQSGICPLKFSSQSLLPGVSIFSFGYPMSHTGETALFVSGNVSGSKKTLAGHSMVVLNCSLNSGNSGGPVLCWVKGQLRVVGVATQKHFKEILTLEERETVEKIRESLQTHAIPDVPDNLVKRPLSGNIFLNYDSYLELHPGCQTSMSLLTLKLYDALETHSQFNLSNALPGHLVIEFIKDSVSKYTVEYKEELAEIIKLSEDQVNILPSGHVSASQCCIQ
ncbi:uncharacterized protein LOC144638564 [Oculina patagonica]